MKTDGLVQAFPAATDIQSVLSVHYMNLKFDGEEITFPSKIEVKKCINKPLISWVEKDWNEGSKGEENKMAEKGNTTCATFSRRRDIQAVCAEVSLLCLLA